MKKLVLVLLLAVASVAAVSAAGFYVSPSADVNVGINNYLRGASLGGQAMFDIGFLALGVEVKAEYDATFRVVDFPLLVILGFGRDFWLGAGYTIPVGDPSLLDANGASLPWELGAFPNTYALGVNFLRVPVPFGAILVHSEISYLVNGPVDATDPLVVGLGQIIGVLVGIKGSAGVAVELKL